MTNDFYELQTEGGCQYKEILELYDFCLKMEIDAKLEQLFDGFKLSFPNGGDFMQHSIKNQRWVF